MSLLNKILSSLYLQVLLAVILAIIFGFIFPHQAKAMKPLGDGFIKLIKMCIPPIIFCTIVSGIVGGSNLSSIGKIGFKTLIYFEILTTLALLIGLAVAFMLKPGLGMNIDPNSIDSSVLDSYVKQKTGLVDFFLNIIPKTIFEAFVSGEILPILFVAILSGFALVAVKEKAQTLIKGIDEVSAVTFKIISYIMKLAPIGAFGAMSYTIGKYGVGSLLPLMKLMLSFYVTCIFFVVVVLGLILRYFNISIFKLIAHIKEEIFIVIGTSSSESVLPTLMAKMEKFGCPKPIVGLVIPTGYSFNLDGTCIYFTMSILFIAQIFNIDLSLMQILGVIFVLLIASKGAAGVTGSGFITLAATLSVIPEIPVAGLAIILGVDRFMSEARAITNLIGNATASVVISKLQQKESITLKT
ncbi:MAG: C4-dicarboxylate transporter DctA [Rickettsiales bacterium]|nr:C4-dicarboxylate transporter DctA [Rickettsiales bacterium]